MFSKFAKWIGRSHDRLTRGKSIALSTLQIDRRNLKDRQNDEDFRTTKIGFF